MKVSNDQLCNTAFKFFSGLILGSVLDTKVSIRGCRPVDLKVVAWRSKPRRPEMKTTMIGSGSGRMTRSLLMLPFICPLFKN
jgi:hypothetical protein